MIVRRNVFETIGLFNETSMLYAEEADFCWRAHKAGFLIAAAPHSRMFHKVSVSTNQTLGRQNPHVWYLRIRNQTRFYSNYSYGLQRGLMAIFSYLRAAGFAILFLYRSHGDLASASMRGWRDGWQKTDNPRN